MALTTIIQLLNKNCQSSDTSSHFNDSFSVPYTCKCLVRRLAVFATVIFFSILTNTSFATGTAAGRLINNSVITSYTIEGQAQPDIVSNVASITVDELIALTLTWQDGSPVNVNTPDINKPITFLLTNAGNGQEAFSLLRNNTLVGDNYNPTNGTAGAIYFENSLETGLQTSGPNADVLYIPGTNDPNLASGSQQIIYVNSDMPSALTNGNIANVGLAASSLTAGVAGSVPGASFMGLGEGGSFAVTGATQGLASSIGSYVVSGVRVTVTKTIISPINSTNLTPGTEIQYRIVVNIIGTGIAQNLVINDQMPAEVDYIANSTTIDATSRTDIADADNTQFLANALNVSLGNVNAPASFTIDFRTLLK